MLFKQKHLRIPIMQSYPPPKVASSSIPTLSSRLRKKNNGELQLLPNLFGGSLNKFLYHLILYFGYFGSLPPAPHEQIFLKIAYAKPTLCRYTLPKKHSFHMVKAAVQIFKKQETPSLETSNFPSAR